MGAEVILAGMEVPPNYGPVYTDSFRKIFQSIAREYNVALIPFFLDGVGGHPHLNQDDGIHPTAEGYDIVVENVWEVLEPLLQKRELEERSQKARRQNIEDRSQEVPRLLQKF
jgi:acyl-CoA thioesterase-1